MKHLKISYKNYTYILLALLVIFPVPSLVIGPRLQPIEGDLTRLGFYSENDFGWNGEQHKYHPPLSKKGILGKRYDIVIIGDSFSANPYPSQTAQGGNYTNTLANETGLQVGVFHITDQPVIELLQFLAEQESPPIAIIYQTVERSMVKRLTQNIVCPEELYKPNLRSTQPEQMTTPVEPVPFYRDTNLGIFDFSYTTKYLLAKLTNYRFNKRVIKARLSRDDLFSNKKSEHVLILEDDYVKTSWSERDWSFIKCGVLNMQNIVQKNGKSNFIFMVAPDKSTIYEPFITDKKMPPSNLSRLESEGLNYLRLDNVLIEHVRAGTVDLYNPNNTHWSFGGHVIVAQELVRYMKRRNIIGQPGVVPQI
jgi:hypothetical protein